MLKPVGIFFLLLFCAPIVQAQKAFLNYYGTSDGDQGNTVLATNDGGYVLINQTISPTTGYFLPQVIKADCNGNIEWTKAFWFANQNMGYDLVAVNSNIAFLIWYRAGGTGDYLAALTLLDYYGNIIWSKTLPLQTTFSNGNLLVEQGGFVICGNSNNAPGENPTTTLVRLDGNGDVTHAVNIQLPDFWTPCGVTRLNMGKYAVVGTYPSTVLPTFKDIAIVVTDEDFVPQKAVVYDTYYDDEPGNVVSDNENNIYVCGRSYFLGNEWDAFVLRFNSNLSPLSIKCYNAGTPSGEVFRHMTNTYMADGLVLCGDIGAFSERDPVMAKIQYNGNVVFSKSYPVSPLFTNYFFSVSPTPDNGFTATGDIRPPFTFRDAPILKTDAGGNDGCFAQDITFNIYTPSYSLNDLAFISTPLVVTSIDTLPSVENILIHQVDVCNPQNPCPAFTYESFMQCPSLCFNFTDQSTGGTAWNWEFEGGTPALSSDQHPRNICYQADGVYKVKLVVSNSTGSSVLEKTIDVKVGCNPIFPNIITPNGDGINDEFTIDFLPAEYELKIFDRWGGLVNTFSEQEKFWNGTNQTGKKVTQGVYFYTFTNLRTTDTFNGFIQVSY